MAFKSIPNVSVPKALFKGMAVIWRAITITQTTKRAKISCMNKVHKAAKELVCLLIIPRHWRRVVISSSTRRQRNDQFEINYSAVLVRIS